MWHIYIHIYDRRLCDIHIYKMNYVSGRHGDFSPAEKSIKPSGKWYELWPLLYFSSHHMKPRSAGMAVLFLVPKSCSDLLTGNQPYSVCVGGGGASWRSWATHGKERHTITQRDCNTSSLRKSLFPQLSDSLVMHVFSCHGIKSEGQK